MQADRRLAGPSTPPSGTGSSLKALLKCLDKDRGADRKVSAEAAAPARAQTTGADPVRALASALRAAATAIEGS